VKYPKICIVLIFPVLLALVVSGCSASLFPGDTASGLRIIIGAQAGFAKTISPDFSDLVFSQYNITIEGDGNIIGINSSSPVVTLDDSQIKALYSNSLPPNVQFTVTVKAYRGDEAGENYSAFGTAKDVKLVPGTTVVVVDIGPIIKEGTQGILNYKITGNGNAILLPYSDFAPDPEPLPDPGIEPDPDSDPAPVEVLTLAAGTDPWSNPEAVPLTVDPQGSGPALNQPLPSGYYMLYYKDSAGKTNVNVVHIYKNFTTKVILDL